ncbi:MAG: hypothetical protein JEY79_11870 [Pseudodesulfovibrio sp.]|nr:hypothetical protein [Pseudodesulfovibrio sp.]
MQPDYEGDELVRAIEIGKQWINRAQGQFSAFVFAKETCLGNVQLRDQILDELVKQRTIARDEKRNGWYHRIDTNLEPMDWINAQAQTYPIWLPLDLHEKSYVSPGNIIILAGESNAGKTAFVMNMIYRNLQMQGGAHKCIKLFNSEMHPAEMRGRLLSIDGRAKTWTGLEPYSRSRDFHLVIDANGFNVIDFMENLDDFWLIGKKIEAIHNELQDGIAVICLQKKKGEDLARGGDFTLEKARLALSLFYDGHANYIRITKCKFPVSYPNPQGQEIDFKIQTGATLVPIEGCGWAFVTKEQRAARTRSRCSEARLRQMSNRNTGYGG